MLFSSFHKRRARMCTVRLLRSVRVKNTTLYYAGLLGTLVVIASCGGGGGGGGGAGPTTTVKLENSTFTARGQQQCSILQEAAQPGSPPTCPQQIDVQLEARVVGAPAEILVGGTLRVLIGDPRRQITQVPITRQNVIAVDRIRVDVTIPSTSGGTFFFQGCTATGTCTPEGDVMASLRPRPSLPPMSLRRGGPPVRTGGIGTNVVAFLKGWSGGVTAVVLGASLLAGAMVGFAWIAGARSPRQRRGDR